MQSTIRFAVLSLLLAGASAGAQTTDCTAITTLPFNVTSAGNYCLKSSLDAGGSIAIDVNADDVTLDFNGFTITGAFFGVRSQSSRKNVTIRNGTVRGGHTGLELSGTGFTVERMRIENTTSVGILIEGANSIIRNNVVVGVTDGTSQCCAYGIYANGAFARVSDNEVLDTGVGRTGESEAIKVVVSPGAVIERNLIANSVKTTGFYPLGIMFLSSGGSKATITGNRFSNFGTAAYASVTGTALLLDNVVANATTPFVGGVIQAGTTNYTY